MMESPLIFGETNFMEVPQICKLMKFMALKKRMPYSNYIIGFMDPVVYVHAYKPLTFESDKICN